MKAFLKGALSCIWLVAAILTMFGLAAVARGQVSPLAAVLLIIDLPLYMLTKAVLPRLRTPDTRANPENGRARTISAEGGSAS